MTMFSYESRFSQALLKLCYGCWLNLLWMICSLPVVTAGAATAALYTASFKIVDDHDSNITRVFFKAFKENFAQATRIWLILLATGILLGLDGYVVMHMRAAVSGTMAVIWTLNLALLICAAVIFTIILMYVFPLIAMVVNNDRAMLKNSLLIGIRYLFCSIVVFAIHFAMFYAVVAVFTPLIIFGEGICALLSSYLMINVIRVCSYIPEDEK